MGPHDGRQHFVVQIPQKPSKMAFYKHVPVGSTPQCFAEKMLLVGIRIIHGLPHFVRKIISVVKQCH